MEERIINIESTQEIDIKSLQHMLYKRNKRMKKQNKIKESKSEIKWGLIGVIAFGIEIIGTLLYCV